MKESQNVEMEQNRIVKLLDGTEVYIKDPTRMIRDMADSEGTKAHYRAINDGCMFQDQMLKFLQEKGIWNNDMEKEVKELQKEREILQNSIEEGGISLEVAKKNAIRCVEIEGVLNGLIAEKLKYLGETVESKKRNATFNYLVASCTVYNNDRGRLYFKTYDDYLNHKDTYDTNMIGNRCSEILYGLPDLDDTPEKRFLKEFDFVDDQMRLVNEDGHLVDFDGRLIDEDGNYIKYVGTGKSKKVVFVDIDGNELTPKERKPFLDKDGNPIGGKKTGAKSTKKEDKKPKESQELQESQEKKEKDTTK